MKRYIYLMLAVLCLTACEAKIDKNVTWPEWASRPIISDASVKSFTGSNEITAGEKVRFHATISDHYNDLRSCSVAVSYGTVTVAEKEFSVSSSEAVIDWEFIMPFAANLEDGGFYPEVSIRARNIAGGESTTRVSKDSNVSVLRPVVAAKLYAIDKSGHSVLLEKVSGSGWKYENAADADLSSLGGEFFIAEKTSAGKPDFSGIVWGMEEGQVKVISEDGQALKLEDTGGYGLSKIGFDIYSFSLGKLLDLCIQVDRSTMDSQSQNGVNYLALENVQLVRDCQVKFAGFGALKDMLQADRYEIIDETTAKFTGHSTSWSFYYDIEDNWMITNYAVFNTSGQLWITGKNACFPLGDDNSANTLNYLAGDGKSRVATLAAVKDSAGDFHILVYLKDNYTIQPFRWIKWSTTVVLTSMTPDTASITDDIFITPGSSFTPGLYNIRFHFTKEPDSNGDGSKAEVYVIPADR